MDPDSRYDVIVIGTGPGGTTAALEAAYAGKRVAAIERKEHLGGFTIHKGTIANTLLRQAILNHVAAVSNRSSRERSKAFDFAALLAQIERVTALESQATSWKLGRNGVTLIYGQATFVDPHTIIVTSDFDTQYLTAPCFVIATGSRPARLPDVPYDGRTILDSDEVVSLPEAPESMVVVGGGVIGFEYANMFGLLGVPTTLIDRHDTLLPFVDREIMEMLLESLQELQVQLRLGHHVHTITSHGAGTRCVHLVNGESIAGQVVLVCIGRQGNTGSLKLTQAGVEVTEDGFIKHDGLFQTSMPHIYAVGDVVGHPALASTSMWQARCAIRRILGQEIPHPNPLIPYALYTIPEVGMVGAIEETLQRDGRSYQVGRARFYDTKMGQILENNHGLLKLIFDPDSERILGVHAVGSAAAEVIHIGQIVMALGGTLTDLAEAVFNYPTLAECYRQAALNGLRKLARMGKGSRRT
ncbi:MAG: Si-specific NAD(P)(+) transhydrogenase [Nitrospirae bacterium]|nr:MAG: Si-specific NAD(P)(+) transhydrogenase [Nitrospirota bacterium]